MVHAHELVLRNARLVLGDEVRVGSLMVRDGRIAALGEDGRAGEDLEGDYLIPGLVELHTDHLETHYSPRAGVRWNAIAATQSHDAQVAASGITTVFDTLRVGTDEQVDIDHEDMAVLAKAIRTSTAEGRLRAEHFIHIRCEVSAPDCLAGFERVRADPLVRMVSLMDHAPGQRQFASLATYAVYYQGKLKMSDAVFAAFVARRVAESEANAGGNREAISAYCRDHGIILASHDDATQRHVEESLALGMKVAEFPTTLEAAEASHQAGMSVLMGAPNVVRGGSHSGNVSARALAEAGLLDILSSDYVPSSLLHAAFALAGAEIGIALPDAIALVAGHPAEAVGLADRGEIAIGRRADLVQVKLLNGVPIVRSVWREGRRVM